MYILATKIRSRHTLYKSIIQTLVYYKEVPWAYYIESLHNYLEVGLNSVIDDGALSVILWH